MVAPSCQRSSQTPSRYRCHDADGWAASVGLPAAKNTKAVIDRLDCRQPRTFKKNRDRLGRRLTKIKKKHGDHPNIAVTLWGLSKGFKSYKIGTEIMKECYDAYYAGEDISQWIDRGEEELNNTHKRPKKRRRR